MKRNFKEGDILQINGKLKKGKAKVCEYLSLEEKKKMKGEMSYDFHCSEPFPQMICEFEDGSKVHYNAKDIYNESKIKLSEDKTWGIILVKSIKEWIELIMIDYTQANYDLGNESDECIISLSKDNVFLNLTDILLEINCTCQIGTKLISDISTDKDYIIELGEFDSETIIFKSASKELGDDEIILKVIVHGYDSTRINLTIDN